MAEFSNTNWQKSPQYLKNIRKLSNLDPGDAAVTQIMINELQGMYASQNMQSMLNSLRIGLQTDQQDRSVASSQARLGLRSKSLDLQRENLYKSYDLKEDAYDFNKKSNKAATLIGWGGVGAGALAGYADYKNKKNYAKNLKKLAGIY